MAAGEDVILDPRALYRGGLARWIPPWQCPLRGPMHEGVQMVGRERRCDHGSRES